MLEAFEVIVKLPKSLFSNEDKVRLIMEWEDLRAWDGSFMVKCNDRKLKIINTKDEYFLFLIQQAKQGKRLIGQE